MTFQITWDCADPARMVAFWSRALGYDVAPPPAGHRTWNDFYLAVGVPAVELDPDGDGADRLVDPTGAGPTIWFQKVPEAKTVKNRLHLDVTASGGRTVSLAERRARVRERVDELVALGAARLRVLDEPGVDHYAETLLDPEGNEFCMN
jgi:hypothetical protein